MSEEDSNLQNPIPVLPSNVALEYLAEGAANIVYRIHFPAQSPSPRSITSLSSSSSSSDTTISKEEEEEEGGETTADLTPSAPHDNSIFKSRLLRLRKSLPSTVPNIQSAKSYREIFQPLFGPENLIGQDLVELPRNLISDANSALQDAETNGLRPSKRRGVYLATDEPYGVLVNDMTSATTTTKQQQQQQQHNNNKSDNDNNKTKTNSKEISIEFKPKWLAQSPNAPPGAKRCRTCALRAAAAQKHPNPSFCPLDLISTDPIRLHDAASHILTANHIPPEAASSSSAAAAAKLRNQLVTFLMGTPLLRQIRQLQLKLDPKGILHPETNPASTDFLIAMTLRDCTIFLKVFGRDDDDDDENQGDDKGSKDADGDGMVEARIGDLDLKSPEGGKVAYWKGVEEKLDKGGWYMGTELEQRMDMDHDDEEEKRRWCAGLLISDI